jgi:hypothetical protein
MPYQQVKSFNAFGTSRRLKDLVDAVGIKTLLFEKLLGLSSEKQYQ